MIPQYLDPATLEVLQNLIQKKNCHSIFKLKNVHNCANLTIMLT